MKLTIIDRVQLPVLFPRQNNLIQLQLAKDIRDKINIDQATIKKINFRIENDSFKWDKEADINVEFTELEVNFLKEQIKELDTNKQIRFEMLDLCTKINKL